MRQDLKSPTSFVDLCALLGEYAEFLRGAGKTVRRASQADAERAYARLDEASASVLADRLRNCLRIFHDMMAAGESLNDSPRFLWRFLRQSGYTPCSDIFGHIGEKDVVEVFSLNQTHLFLNLNFFDYVSITLERLFMETWYQATRRDMDIVRQLQGMAAPVLRGAVNHTFVPSVPKHVVEEVDTELMLKFTVLSKAISPFYAAGRLAGFISVAELESI